MYLLDTNVVSALRRPERNQAVSQWLFSQSPDDPYISVITIGEIEYGIARQRRRQPEFASRLEDWMESVRTSFSSHILLFDEASARHWAVCTLNWVIQTRTYSSRPSPLNTASL